MWNFGSVPQGFLSICSALAWMITTVSEWTAYVLHCNYLFVTGVYTSVCAFISAVTNILDFIICTVTKISLYIFDFLCEIYACVFALFVLVWHICALIYKVACLIFSGIENVVLGIWNGGVFSVSAMYSAAKAVAVSFQLLLEHFSALSQEAVVFICNGFTLVGNFSKALVSGIWYFMGYVPSTIACIPMYLKDWLSNILLQLQNWIFSTLKNVNHDTYLGLFIVCIVCLVTPKLVKFWQSRRMMLSPLLFRQRPHSRMRQQGWNATNDRFAFDAGFESDVDIDDDFAGSDAGGYEDDDNNAEDAGSDTQTELTLSDNESDDDSTVGSDSDVSLDSQTFSSESEGEIDIRLPPEGKGSSAQSRSSTPSRILQNLNHEEYLREIERERERRKCVVCQDNNKSVLILPCRHMCLCVGCANRIVRSEYFDRRLCPLCRSRIESVINVYV